MRLMRVKTTVLVMPPFSSEWERQGICGAKQPNVENSKGGKEGDNLLQGRGGADLRLSDCFLCLSSTVKHGRDLFDQNAPKQKRSIIDSARLLLIVLVI